MSFGVTYDVKNVEKASSYTNTQLSSTWVYSRPASMPGLIFNGKIPGHEDDDDDDDDHDDDGGDDVPGFTDGDRIAVHVNPDEKLVRFYKNGNVVASNLPGHPLEIHDGRPYRMYVMVDELTDRVSVVRFGPGEPYDD
eukprot:TRINITY_DN36615_c0_g1_i1.p1 TRINITY_DN36615_c0_g1~~TRINITY_DN36615_c0_g1_i1.p1  ORF type:complete len:138 (+),score=25.51 TRINITY_DN36615_c0_g1_i1:462-875(+)